ncbi:hypothetical protein GCM10011519_14740 [Marmoricola endophyticus]|uniref:DUF3027 domain-containing protein n=1 Tax=Marmoricola endophyticus TaxID=2040280 RepID=A0A917BIT1_9ACTN|nr:DUF3027 domain-containing protein [Marmoricola endophyticus]GGF41962.1 hypothetical protein GCM10011519_14740 [Marmoricola endophyticus]
MTPTDQPAADGALERAARTSLVAQVGADVVGDHVRSEVEAPEGAVTCYFVCTQPGYPGWEWAVTLAGSDESGDAYTLDELVLLPGAEAIVAPAWVPYRERIQSGDLSPGDLLPTDEDDARLVPTFLAGDDDEPDDDRQQLRSVAKEIGLGRTRVLSVEGREQAADRWLTSDHGPDSQLAKQAPHSCWSCGFLVRLAGPLSASFGVCANEFANDDGRVVSYGHGCGAHSEAQLRTKQLPLPVPDPVFDTLTPEDLERF